MISIYFINNIYECWYIVRVGKYHYHLILVWTVLPGGNNSIPYAIIFVTLLPNTCVLFPSYGLGLKPS